MAAPLPYVYSPLDTAKRTIRLIEIVSGTSSTIDCKFHYFDLSDRPKYRALSYAWGPAAPTTKLLVDGKSFTIRENLGLALQQIRATAGLRRSTSNLKDQWPGRTNHAALIGSIIDAIEPEYWWIDAICIDQGSVLERNHQVKMMKDIYSHASSVYAWLGEEADDSSLAFDFFHRFETNQPLLKALENKPRRRAILALYKRPYWKRVWVIQEIILGRDITVMCGYRQCSWFEVVDFHVVLQMALLARGAGAPYHPSEDITLTCGWQMISNRIYWHRQNRAQGAGSLARLEDLLVMWPE